jgi:hypothetical protein
MGSSQHEASHCKGSFGELTVMDVGFIESNVTAFANVPSNRAWVLGVGSVGPSLAICAHRPDATEDGMDEKRQQRMEEVHDVHDDFDEQDEHGEYGDNDIVIRQTIKNRISIIRASSNLVVNTMEDHIQVAPHQRRFWDWLVVGVSIEYLSRAGIKAILEAIPPQQCPV